MTRRRTWIAITVGVLLVLGALLAVAVRRADHGQPPVEEPVGEGVDLHGDPLPPGASARLGTIRFRMGRGASGDLAFVDDGARLLTGFNQRRMAVFDARTGKRERILRGHRETIPDPTQRFDPVAMLVDPDYGERDDQLHGFVVAPDGRTAYSVGLTLRRWNLDDGSSEVLLEALPTLQGSSAISPDGALVAFPSAAGLHLFDTAAERARLAFPDTATRGRRFVTFARDGELLGFTGGGRGGGTVLLMDLEAGGRPRPVGTVQGWVMGAAVTHDGTVWAAGAVGPVRAWSADDRLLHTVEPPQGARFRSLAVSPDGSLLAIVWRQDAGTRVALHRTDDAAQVADIGPVGGSAHAATFSPDGTRLAVTTTGGAIVLVDVPGRVVASPPLGHRSSILSLAVSPDSSRVATLGQTGEVRVWDRVTGADRARIPLGRLMGSLQGRSLAFSPGDGARLRAVLWEPPTEHVFVEWDAATGEELRREPVPRGEHWGLRFTPTLGRSGERLLCYGRILPGHEDEDATMNGVLLVRDAATMEPIHEIGDMPSSLPLAGISGDGRRIVWFDSRLRIAPVDGSSAPIAIDPRPLAPRDAAVAPGGAYVAVVGVRSSAESRLMVWDLAEQQLVVDVEIGDERTFWRNPETVAFSADGTLVATGGPDRACRVWSVPGGQLLTTFEGHIGGIRAIAFSPDGAFLVTASDDTTALVWDLRNAIERR